MKNIYFKYKHIKNNPKKYHLWDSIYIQMFHNDEMIGYANLSFISQPSAHDYLKNPFDFFIYKINCSNLVLKKAYKKQNIEKILTLLNIPFSQEDKISIYQDFYKKIEKDYQNAYQNFYDYWVEKPSIDIITIFSEKDIYFTDFFHQQEKQKRLPISYQGQGYGKLFYQFIINLLQKKNYYLWESKTQTEDAKKVWKSLEKNKQFQLLSSSFFPSKQFLSSTINLEARKFLLKC